MRLVAATLVGIAIAGCAGPRLVERRDGARLSVGVETNPEALAFFVEALRLEKAGDFERARGSAELALRKDPESGHGYALVGRLVLRTDPKRAFEVWREGLEVAREKAPIYREKARAHFAREETEAALEAARLAVLSAPSNPEHTELYAELLGTAGRTVDAERVRRTHELLTGEPRPVPRGLASDRIFDGDSSVDLAQLDALLLREDVEEARRLAKGSRSDAELAFRLLTFGRPAAARALARRRLTVDPDDPCATLAEVVASDRAGAESPLEIAPAAFFCPEGRAFLLEVLQRRGVPTATLFRDHPLGR